MMNFPLRKTNKSWYPLCDIQNLHKEMDRLFNFAFPQCETEGSFFGGHWAPAIDVVDSEDNLVVRVDLPGLTKKNINVSVQDDLLTISGEKKQESKVKEKDYLRTERYQGSFRRMLKLPAYVDSMKAKATFKDGVLELTLPKQEKEKLKQVMIDVE